jgi:acetyltransferase-like isoleucine patch superfamily enzyme
MKTLLKQLTDLCFTIFVFPLFCIYFLCRFAGIGDSSFWTISQFLSLFPGLSGNYLRKHFYRLSMTRCDRDCAVLFGTIFSQADTEIGKGVYIGPNCNIGRCKIADHCTLGTGVHVMSGSRQHNFDDLNTPIQEQGGVFEKIVIGEDTWIGNCALIMANVGKKCIIGAGAVVTKDIDDFSVAAGNPAKVIRKRIF